MTTVADATCTVCGGQLPHHSTDLHRLAPELARLRRIEAAAEKLADCAAAVVVIGANYARAKFPRAKVAPRHDSDTSHECVRCFEKRAAEMIAEEIAAYAGNTTESLQALAEAYVALGGPNDPNVTVEQKRLNREAPPGRPRCVRAEDE